MTVLTDLPNSNIVGSGPYGDAIPGLSIAPDDQGQQQTIRSDDLSSDQLVFPFPLNFFGQTISNYFVNNNGNISFNSPIGDTYTPELPSVANQPVIAPWWADVDTRPAESGLVYRSQPDPNTVIITWDNVGYYNTNGTKTNTFQLVLKNAADQTGVSGDFDLEFRYNNLNWTAGDSSGGKDGLVGTSETNPEGVFPTGPLAGLDGGDGANSLRLPGSFTDRALELKDTSNIGEPGVWAYDFRNGVLQEGTPPPPPGPDISLLDTAFSRFYSENSNTYLYTATGGEEYNSLQGNANYREEGFAFGVAVQPGDGLMTVNRFQKRVRPGSEEGNGVYLYSGPGETDIILNNPEFSNKFLFEGPAFYALSPETNIGTDIFRGQYTTQSGIGKAYFMSADPAEFNGLQAGVNEGVIFEAAI